MSNKNEIRTLDKALAGLHEIAERQKREYREHAARRKAEGYEHVGGGVYVKGSAEAKADMRRQMKEAAGEVRGTMRNPKPVLTRDMAWAASADAGNRSMRAAGRKHWSEEDRNAAIAEFDRLWPAEQDVYQCHPPPLKHNPGVGPGRRFHVTKGYVRERLRDPKEFDSRSFRTKDIGGPGGHKMIVGCARGKWHPRGKAGAQCGVGMTAQAILHPLSEREVLLATGRCPMGVAMENRNPKGSVVKLTGRAKTDEEWSHAKVPLGKFLSPGDAVDDVIHDYMRDVLPPACMNQQVLQMGEPYDHLGRGYQARYFTLQRHGQKWIYTGLHERGEVVGIEKE